MTQGELDGQVALVTGAAGDGIGRAVAHRFAAEGAAVAVTDIHPGRIAATVEAIWEDTGARVLGLELDITRPADADAVIEQVTAELGPVRILVNNAALNELGSVFEFDLDRFREILTADLVTPWYLSRLVFPGMRDAGGGVIVNISSVAPDLGQACLEPPYSLAKGGLHALTKGVARAGGPFNVRANAVTMGVIEDTKFMRTNTSFLDDELPKVPLGRHGRVRDIVEAVLYLASERASFVNGEVLKVDGGYCMGS